MATSYTTLLGLALPVTGELSGTWGDTVNDYITQYLDAAIAGTQTISGSQTAVTLSKTTNASLGQAGSGATGSSQYQIINCTGNPGGLLTITAPAASKAYLVLNNTSTNQSVKVVGTGPTTGVTVAAARCALIAWNGSDFELVASTDITALQGTLATTNGGTGLTSFTANGVMYASSTSALTTGSALTFDGTNVSNTGRFIVNNAGSAAGTADISLGSLSGGAWLNTPSGTVGYLAVGGNAALAYSSSQQIWYASGSEQMRLTSTGLGIGTSSPNYLLHLNGSPQIQFTNSTTGTTSGDGAHIYLSGSDWWLVNKESAAMVFATNNTERARITSGGEFVIGGTSASSGFPLTLDKSTGGGLVLKHNGTDKAYFFLNGSTVSRWETVTGATIEVSSGNSNGVSLANGGTSWGSLSDERKKDIIEPITDAANKVSTLRAVIGKYKTDDEGTRRSFLIAQDVQAVLPEAVVADGSGDLILQYTETIPLLVAAIKEQQAIIKNMTARVAALESK